MNWLSMMSDEDKRQIVKELASRLSAEPILASAFENAVEKVFEKYIKINPSWMKVYCNIIHEHTPEKGCFSPRLTTAAFESAVEKVLRRYNFQKIAGENSLKRLTTADQPLIDLLNTSQKLCASVEAIFDKSKKWEIVDLTTPVILAADAVIKLYKVKL